MQVLRFVLLLCVVESVIQDANLFCLVYSLEVKLSILITWCTAWWHFLQYFICKSFLVWYIFCLFLAVYSVGAKLTREFFIAIDPITSLHMGICKCQETIDRAKRLSEVIRKRLHDYLSSNEENRKNYRDAHYSEMEPVAAAGGDSSMPPLIVEDYTPGTTTPVNDSSRSGGVTFSFPSSDPQPKRESVTSVESEMHISTKRPGFGGGVGSGGGSSAQRFSVISTVTQEGNCDVGLDSSEFVEDDITVPTLEEIFTGPKPLLLYGPQKAGEDSIISFGVGRKDVERNLLMSLDDCSAVMQVLTKQGCTTTESLVMLLKWHTYNNCSLKTSSNGGVAFCSYGKVELNECVKVCVQMGMPMFHAVLVIDYLKTYL